MLFEEARRGSMVDHPHVVRVHQAGEDRLGPFLLMDYVEGTSVARLLQAASQKSEEIPLQVCTRIVRHAALGLHAAHEVGLVHGDVSPSNILVGRDGIARVADFGVLAGKPGYMSPERLRGEEPDASSDVFALGVVWFELLTRRRLYQGIDGRRRMMEEPPPDPNEHRDDVPAAVVQLLFLVLAKDRTARPSAEQLARRLTRR